MDQTDNLKSDKKDILIGNFLIVLLISIFAWGIWGAPTEEHMGEVYRIIYVHVPAAFTAFFSSAILFGLSIWAMLKRSEASMRWGQACSEIGLLFTCLALATGSIWGKPTWGVWWTWDARLTTTLILALLFAGYLLLKSSLPAGPQRTRICGALGIMIFVNVYIVYKSVTWWRTLHQPPSLMRSGEESTMDPEMRVVLLIASIFLIAVGYWLMKQRAKNLNIQAQLDQLSYDHLS